MQEGFITGHIIGSTQIQYPTMVVKVFFIFFLPIFPNGYILFLGQQLIFGGFDILDW
jgi:hypothetical protein